MHYLLPILTTLSLASAIPLPQYNSLTPSDFLTPPDSVASNPWDTTFTDTPNTNVYVPNSPVLISEGWSQKTPDGSWNGKDRDPVYDRTGFGGQNVPAQDPYAPGSTWPATPSRDGSHAPLFRRPNPNPNNEGDAAPVPLPEGSAGTGGTAGAAGAATLILKGIFDGGNSQPAGGF